MKPIPRDVEDRLDELCEALGSCIDDGLLEEDTFDLKDYFWIDKIETFLEDARRVRALSDLLRRTEKKG